MNGDDCVKTLWGTCFVFGEQGHKKTRCPTRKESVSKATVQPQRSSSIFAPSAGVLTGARLRATSSAASSVPQGPARRTRSDVAGKSTLSYRIVSMETQGKEEGHVDQVQGPLTFAWNRLKCTSYGAG